MPATIALADVTLRRPLPSVEVTRASPAPRDFPARTSAMLGICLKLGAAHDVVSDGRLLRYPADSICVRPAGTVWASRTPPVGFVSIDIAPDSLPEAAAPGPMRFLPRDAAPDILLAAHRLEHPRATALAREEVLIDLIDSLAAAGALRLAAESSAAAPLAITRARELLHATLDSSPHSPAPAPSLDSLASASGANKFVLLRGFRRALGTTPHAYLVALRVDRARALLARGVPAAETAAATGFADQSHLGRHFKRAFGLSPAEYARRARAVNFVPDRCDSPP